MFDNHPGILRGRLPIHAFYLPQPAGIPIPATSSSSPTSTLKPAAASRQHSTVKPSIAAHIPHSSTAMREIQTPSPKKNMATVATTSYGISTSASISSGSSLAYATPSTLSVVSNMPPQNETQSHDRAILGDNHVHGSGRENCRHWVAPLLGVLGAMGVLTLILAFCVLRRRKNRALDSDNQPTQSKITDGHYESWASFSTINTSAAAAVAAAAAAGNHTDMEDEKRLSRHMSQPPPAYTPKKQKRLTSDTLVEEQNSMNMLKSQYAPQLAFSPSLVAGEFQQQTTDHPPLPELLSANNISPSNTLIDNAGVLDEDQKDENYYAYNGDYRPRIEMYDPQVNLHDDEDSSNPFDTPYNYPNDANTRPTGNINVTGINADSDAAHQTIHMNHYNNNKEAQ